MPAYRWVILFLGVVLMVGIGWFVVRSKSAAPPPTPDSESPAAAPVATAPEPAPPLPSEPSETLEAPASETPVQGEGLSIRGHVYDGAQQPVGGAMVAAYSIETSALRAKTDDSGAYIVWGLKPGRYRISAQHPYYNEAVKENVSAETQGVDLVLTDLSSAAGTVVDAESGTPIPAFEAVYLNVIPADRGHWERIARSDQTRWQSFEDPEGRFAIEDVASSTRFTLGARAEGYEPEYAEAGPAEPGQQAEPVVIRMKREARVEGKVLSPEGEPVAGAAVHLGLKTDKQPLATTDASGAFVLAGLSDQPIELTAAHADYLNGSTRVTPVRGRSTAAEIRMGQGGTIEGTVKRGEQPLADAAVTASRLELPRIRKQTRTDAEGKFVINGIGDGTVDVLAKVIDDETGNPLRLQHQAVVEPGKTTVVDFQFSDAVGTVEGTVTLNGAPPRSASVKLNVSSDGGDAVFSTSTGEDGLFRFDKVPAGQAWLQASADTDQDTSYRKTLALQVTAGETVRADVAFEAAGVINGMVSNLASGDEGEVMALPGKVPLDDITVDELMQLERLQVGRTPIAEDGSFRLEGLEPGQYTLVAIVLQPDAGDAENVIDTVRLVPQAVTVAGEGEVKVNLAL